MAALPGKHFPCILMNCYRTCTGRYVVLGICAGFAVVAVIIVAVLLKRNGRVTKQGFQQLMTDTKEKVAGVIGMLRQGAGNFMFVTCALSMRFLWFLAAAVCTGQSHVLSAGGKKATTDGGEAAPAAPLRNKKPKKPKKKGLLGPNYDNDRV